MRDIERGFLDLRRRPARATAVRDRYGEAARDHNPAELEEEMDRRPRVSGSLKTVLAAGMPAHVELELAAVLPRSIQGAPQSELPDISGRFRDVEALNPSAPTLRTLEPRIETIVRNAATTAFKP